MATLSFVTHTPVSNIPLLSRLYTILSLTHMILHSHLFNPASSIPITPSDTENYLPSDDPNITNLMVSHYDCATQHNLRQFNLLNVKQCTEAPSDIQHASVKARVYVRAKAKRIKAFKCVAYAKKERKICFQGSVKYRRVDRNVWNHNTLPLPVTLDPLECKNLIRHLNGTNNKILNNLNYNKTFTLLEDHYFQERLEQYQTPFTVYQLNKIYTGTFTFMPADEKWIYDPTKNPYHNCPAHHQFEVKLVSWRLEISEVELTYDDTANVMIIDGHTLHCDFADGFCKPTTKTPFTLVWFNDFCLIFTLQDFLGRMTKIKIDIGLKLILLYIPHIQVNLKRLLVIKVQNIPMSMLLIHNIPIIQVFHVLKYTLQLKHSVLNQINFILHNIQIFLLHTLMVSTCIQDNQTLIQ